MEDDDEYGGVEKYDKKYDNELFLILLAVFAVIGGALLLALLF
jgi:hypothetical protein